MKQDEKKLLPILLFIPSQFMHLVISSPRYCPFVLAANLPSTGVSCAMQAK